ncbi:MAG: hypothetical protein A2V52_02795 [Actinobacteria bacterium RBG_19FT_COMBO_54_7]|nr:MAG: hypothetical protein A2V52_02795 [Actinobacteria bacterium RBG_19FT_COMBO_54_7]
MTTSNSDITRILFNPRRMAVIGASANLGKWGHIVPTNIIRGNYTGELFLVNPGGGEIHGTPIYRSLEEIGRTVDLAMLTIPAQQVERVFGDCSRAGIKVVIAISGGFSESSSEGKAMEERMVKAAASYGIRIVGPNTMGIYSAPWSLSALMPPVAPQPGHIAFAAQSGNLGPQLLGWGSHRGIGFSRFVCVGNESDLDFADYLEYFAEDDETKVILLYVEGFKRPRRVLELAERISLDKPFVIYKAGTTRAGHEAAASHSAAMAGSSEIYGGMIRQGGMIRAETTEEMLDFCDALVKTPLPRSRSVGILSWGGGWGVIAADLCERAGFDVSPLPDYAKKSLGDVLPTYWSKGNPVDMVGIVDLDAHTRCLELLSSCPEYDSIISLGTINAATAFGLAQRESEKLDKKLIDVQRQYMEMKASQFGRRVYELMRDLEKPILAVGMPEREKDLQEGSERPNSKICTYTNPERAVRVAEMLVERAEYLRSRQEARS